MAKIANKTAAEGVVTFAFTNGKNVSVDLNELPREMVHKLAEHGMLQKGGDSYAGAESIVEAIANVTEVIQNLKNGIWATRATGGKLAEALSRATGQPLEVCIGKLQSMDEKAKRDLRKHPQIKLALAEIDRENAAKQLESAGDTTEELPVSFD